MENKPMNEATVNEVLHELRTTYKFDWIKDVVTLSIYYGNKLDSNKIGLFYNIDHVGEYIIEKSNIKSYQVNVQKNVTDNYKFVDIKIVLKRTFDENGKDEL